MPKWKQLYHWLRAQLARPLVTYGIILALLSGMIIYQQIIILDLQNQVQEMKNVSGDDSLANKIYHLEYNQDSHTSDIYKTKIRVEKLEDRIRNMLSAENELKWRIMQLEWGYH